MELIFFPGKNTHIKRYKPYFPGWVLRPIKEDDHPDVVVCHSYGIVDALTYCNEHKIYPHIVSMDGTNLTNTAVETAGFYICSFRSRYREGEDDNNLYQEQYYYDLPKNRTHYPYTDRTTRDKIVRKIHQLKLKRE